MPAMLARTARTVTAAAASLASSLTAAGLIAIAVATVAAAAAAAPPAAAAQTADELVAKNNQAQGGRRLREVKSARVTATLKVVGTTDSSPMLIEFVPPRQRVRLDITEANGVNTMAYDGAVGWSLNLGDGETESKRLTGDALRSIKDTADFQGPLFDARAKGNEVVFLGKAEIAGAPAYKLRLSTTDGEETIVYLDATTYLVMREESTRGGPHDRVEKATVFSGYKTFAGVTMATIIESTQTESLNGGSITTSGGLRIEIEKVDLDVEIPASRFARPNV